MRITRAAALAGGVLLAMSGSARAVFYTGNQILEFCTAAAGTNVGRCLGYLEAVEDAGEENAAGLTVSNKTIGRAYQDGYVWCLPPGADSGQLRDVVVKYLRDNPRNRHASAPGQVAAAYTRAWPCPK